MKEKDFLKLENQLCFPLYALSRKVTKIYQPFLAPLDLTYPQYLVMLVLWEKNEQSVKEIGELLDLESNTLTPLLKRMEGNNLLERKRAKNDERKVVISLTPKGKALREKAEPVPMHVFEVLGISSEDAEILKNILCKLMRN